VFLKSIAHIPKKDFILSLGKLLDMVKTIFILDGERIDAIEATKRKSEFFFLVPGFLFEKMRLAADAATCPNHATTLVTEQDGSLKLEPCCQEFSMNKFMSLLSD